VRYGSTAFFKAIIVAVVALLLLVPVQMLRSLVRERAAMREQAIASVSRGWGGRQMVGGPIIAIPATIVGPEPRAQPLLRDWYILPESLQLESELTVQDERRKLGVYEVPVYVAKVHAIAKFDVAAKAATLAATQLGVTLHLDHARILIPVSDVRGVRNVTLQDEGISAGTFEPQSGFPIATLGAALSADTDLQKGVTTLDLSLEIAGTDELQFLPLAHSTSLKLAGNWPDPGFARGFLPTIRKIEAGRFEASWQILDLNRGYGSHWFQDEIAEQRLTDSAFGVDIVQPVDLYQQAERSVKYAGLFIALTLLTMFLWEHLANRSLHPVQYGLIGLALSVFYLLLLALAEHIGFAKAYAMATLALCSLLGVYIAGAFNNAQAGGGSGVAFGATYGLLYLLITSEDYSLLAGALGLFAILATVMVLTRRIDWYRAGAKLEESVPESQ
jgi:inner membrane protein